MNNVNDTKKVKGTYVTVWFREDLLRIIDITAKSLGLSRASLIRNAVLLYLNSMRPLLETQEVISHDT